MLRGLMHIADLHENKNPRGAATLREHLEVDDLLTGPDQITGLQQITTP